MSSPLIFNPADLKPETQWSETVWAWTAEEKLVNHRRRTRLCAAALLPFVDGKPDWEGFRRSIQWMIAAGDRYGVEMVFVLNADTGYIFQLSDQLYAEVLRRFREFFPGRRFIAGVTAKGGEADSGFRAERYRGLIDLVQQHENCEVMLMTSRHLSQLPPAERRDAYYEIAGYLTHPALVHALEPAFVPWATTFEPWLLWQLALHPKFVGGKISTLDEPHFLYWAAMCDDLRLSFVPHSGDDFGIATAIRLGQPLLVGAAVTAAPLICAAKDMWLDDAVAAKRGRTGRGGFDTRVYKLFEALQSLEDVVFRLDARGSAAAYKHSTAHLLYQLGILDSPEIHPECPDLRGDDEPERVTEALIRVRRVAARLGIPGYEV